MTVESVANYIGLADSEVDDNKDVDVETIANILGISDREAVLIAALGTPLSLPDAPTGLVPTVIDATHVSVAFVPPVNDGGAKIEKYTITSSVDGGVGEGIQSPVVVQGPYAQGTGYLFTGTATNRIGTGAVSVPSNAVTPNP